MQVMKKNQKAIYKTLDNGLRLVVDSVDTVDTVALGIWVGVGTRFENPVHNGIAHMTEHMMFKGTDSRNAIDISKEIENVGGHMNAYTGREVTGYFVHMLKEHVDIGMDIISDMVKNATIPEGEIEREKQVIIQEIGMSLDTPDDYIFDLYHMRAYPEQSLGNPILGNAEIVSSITREDIKDYINRYYNSGNIVVSFSGNIDLSQAEDLVGKYLSDINNGERAVYLPAKYQGGENRHEKSLEQAHIIIGFEGFARTSRESLITSIMASILGGGMSSRLFQEVREKRGLAYSVFASQSGYHDSGQLEIYAGTSPERIEELIPAICDEICSMSKTISEEEFKRAVTQRKSDMLMSMESMMHRTDRNARYAVYYDKAFDIEDQLTKLAELNIEDIRNVATKIFSGTPCIAALGSLKNLETYEKLSSRIL